MAASGRLDSTFGAALMLLALEEARVGADEGGIPIGATLVRRDGTVLGRGHNRRVQSGDPTAHAETEAFRAAGRRRQYGELVMVTTLSPCWFCSGLIRQFGIGAVVIGESRNFSGGHEWLRDLGVEIVELDDPACTSLLRGFITRSPALWGEDIGQ